ncbi:hypothetical protein [Pseudaestuariivita sp.]|uniref:hypothetical protein n=1 Tax=Pseudaestuariivita sp. TaxID=2211669 RepID=UPI0040595F9C
MIAALATLWQAALGAPWLALAAAVLTAMLLNVVTAAQRGATPGLRLAGLRLDGQGCAVCWELRRFGPLAALAFLGGIAELRAPGAGWIAAALIAAWTLLRAVQAEAGALPHDARTGIQVIAKEPAS